MNPHPRWDTTPDLADPLLKPPSRSGYTVKGEMLRAWVYTKPLYYLLYAAPVFGLATLFYFWFSGLDAEHQAKYSQMNVFVIAFILVGMAMCIGFAFSRLDLRITPKQISFRMGILGFGRWHHMPLASLAKVALRGRKLNSGSHASMEYMENVVQQESYHVGLVIKGAEVWEMPQGLHGKQAIFFRDLILHAHRQSKPK